MTFLQYFCALNVYPFQFKKKFAVFKYWYILKTNCKSKCKTHFENHACYKGLKVQQMSDVWAHFLNGNLTYGLINYNYFENKKK